LLLLLAPTIDMLRLELIVPMLLKRTAIVPILVSIAPLLLLLLPALATRMEGRLILRPLGLVRWSWPLTGVAALLFPPPTAGGEPFLVVTHPLLRLWVIGEKGSARTVECAAKLAAPSSILSVLAAEAELLLPLFLRLPILPIVRWSGVLVLVLVLVVLVVIVVLLAVTVRAGRRRRRHLPPTFVCATKLTSSITAAAATTSSVSAILAHMLPAAAGFSAAFPRGLLVALVLVLIPIPSGRSIMGLLRSSIVLLLRRRADAAVLAPVGVPGRRVGLGLRRQVLVVVVLLLSGLSIIAIATATAETGTETAAVLGTRSLMMSVRLLRRLVLRRRDASAGPTGTTCSSGGSSGSTAATSPPASSSIAASRIPLASPWSAWTGRGRGRGRGRRRHLLLLLGLGPDQR